MYLSFVAFTPISSCHLHDMHAPCICTASNSQQESREVKLCIRLSSRKTSRLESLPVSITNVGALEAIKKDWTGNRSSRPHSKGWMQRRTWPRRSSSPKTTDHTTGSRKKAS